MKLIRLFLIVTVVFSLGSCSEDNEMEEISDIGYVAPEPPEQQLQENIFSLRIFSKFSDEPLFSSNNYDVVTNKISSANDAYVSFLDRVDAEFFTIERNNPVVEIANMLKQVAFFAPSDYNDKSIEGTGIIVKGLVAEYNGQMASDGFLVTGPVIRIMVANSFMLKTGTCKISSDEQINSFSEMAQSFISEPRLVVGTISSSLKDEFEEHMKMHAVDFRITVISDDNEWDYVPFVFGPLEYTYRTHELEQLHDQINSVTIRMEALQ